MKEGDRVRHSSGSIGTVVGFKENGWVKVQWDDGGHGEWNPDYIHLFVEGI